MEKPIMTKEEFDLIIKTLIDKDELFGYKHGSGKFYPMYYSNDVFDKFVKDMSEKNPKAYDSYKSGAGKELDPGMYPPKMASVASSSRFCYLALSEEVDIGVVDGSSIVNIKGHPEFEYECVINEGFFHHPQLDAFIPESNCYFEVKCHEIFDHHKVELKKQYWKYVYGDKNAFGYKPKEDYHPDSETFELPLFDFGLFKDYSMFDIKQLICHLLGIAKQPGENKKLVYLFFLPDILDKYKRGGSQLKKDMVLRCNYYLERVKLELADEISHIFSSKPILTFCEKNDIKLYAIAQKSSVMEPLKPGNYDIFAMGRFIKTSK
ncbi:MAG: hypothetical protein IJL67_13690 [Oscillospiraceae bacterium]|nr:hypothetical protein [Oscillospiraceae bacterium]